MLSRLAAVAQDVGVGAAGFFQSVSEDGQAVESSVVVDRLGESSNSGSEPSGIEGDGLEWIAEEFPKNVALGMAFISMGTGFPATTEANSHRKTRRRSRPPDGLLSLQAAFGIASAVLVGSDESHGPQLVGRAVRIPF
jgi:hypothetical protein